MSGFLKALVLMLVASGAYAQNIGGTPFIAVRGHAEQRFVPDIFPIRIEVSDKSLDTGKAQKTVEDITAGLLVQARTLGLVDADISVGNLEISPDSRYDQQLKREVFLGNEYSRTVGFRFHKLADLQKFVATIPARKEAKVTTQAFSLSNVSDARRRMMAMAIADAKNTAELLAAAVGKRVLGIQTISDRPLTLSMGSYVNPIDVASLESSTILTEAQIDRIPMGRNVSSMALQAPGSVRTWTDVAFSEGVIAYSSDVYVIYLLGD